MQTNPPCGAPGSLLITAVSLIMLGCVETPRTQTVDKKPLSYYQQNAIAASQNYVLVDDYSYGGIALLGPPPSGAKLNLPLSEDEVPTYRHSVVDEPFKFAVLDVADGQVVGLMLVAQFDTAADARSFFSAAYSVLSNKYSDLIAPVTNANKGPITAAYWSFSTRKDWIDHVASTNKHRADMAWVYKGKPYEPPSAISDVLYRVSIGVHGPSGPRATDHFVAVSYETNILRGISKERRKALIESLDL